MSRNLNACLLGRLKLIIIFVNDHVLISNYLSEFSFLRKVIKKLVLALPKYDINLVDMGISYKKMVYWTCIFLKEILQEINQVEPDRSYNCCGWRLVSM